MYLIRFSVHYEVFPKLSAFPNALICRRFPSHGFTHGYFLHLPPPPSPPRIVVFGFVWSFKMIHTRTTSTSTYYFYVLQFHSSFGNLIVKMICFMQFFLLSRLRPATLLKKRLWYRCFLVKFAKFLTTPFLKEHPWWLLLDCQIGLIQ